jgi:hypothetical protein
VNDFYATPIAPTPKPTNGLATAALTLGIVGAILSFAPVINVVALVLAVLAVVFAIVGLSRVKHVRVGRGRAVAALVLAAATLALVPTINAAFFNSTTDTVAAVEEPAPVEEQAEPVEKPAPEPKPEPEEPSLTVSQEQALLSAEGYLAVMPFSKSGLAEQLAYEGFANEDGSPSADALYAVDAVDADWSEQAVLMAASYLETMPFSRQGLIDQLVYEGFTTEQATYGVDGTGL